MLQIIVNFLFVMLVLGLPLLAGAIALGVWIRRTNRSGAFRTFLGASASAATGLLATVVAILLTWLKERRAESLATIEHHPLSTLLIVGVWLIAALAAVACVVFALWTAWWLVARPPTPLGTTPAT